MRFNKSKYYVAVLVAAAMAFTPISLHAMDKPDDAPMSNNWEDQTKEDLEARAYYLHLNEVAEMNYHVQTPTNVGVRRTNRALSLLGTSSLIGQGWASNNLYPLYQDNYTTLLCPNSSSNSPSIASAGCVITSFAMIANKYNYNTTPPEVVYQINTYAPGIQNACSFPWSSMKLLPKYSGIGHENATVPYKESEALATVRGIINSGKPALVYMRSGNSSHAVVCYGYEVYSVNGQNVYYHYIFNPSLSATNSGKTTIESYMATWYIEQIHTYYRS